MSLELSSLKKAIISLEKAINIAQSSLPFSANTDLNDVIRAGVTQNFELTYELCWKFMGRWLEKNLGASSIDGVSRKELFRIAAEKHLIDKTENWFDFH